MAQAGIRSTAPGLLVRRMDLIMLGRSVDTDFIPFQTKTSKPLIQSLVLFRWYLHIDSQSLYLLTLGEQANSGPNTNGSQVKDKTSTVLP